LEREYIAARRQAPLSLSGSWILFASLNNGKKIENSSHGV